MADTFEIVEQLEKFNEGDIVRVELRQKPIDEVMDRRTYVIGELIKKNKFWINVKTMTTRRTIRNHDIQNITKL